MALAILGATMPTPASDRRTMRIGGLSHQLALWSDETQDREIAMVGPLGCGKTFALAIKAALLSERNRGVDGLLVVPSYRVARKTHVRDWPRILADLGLPVRYLKSDAAFEWPWGDRLWIGTADNPDSLVGPNMGHVLFDEPGLMDSDALERGSTRARHPEARVRQKIYCGTPEGTGNRFAEMFADPREGRRTIWARTWHASMRHYRSQLLETYGYDESLLATYAGGKFVPLRVGRAWRFYDPAKHLGEPGYDSNVPLVLACDFNVDAMRWETGQFPGSEIRWLDEIALGRDGTTEAGAQEFVRRWGNGRHHGDVIVTGDASGKARSTSGRTDYQIIAEELAKGRFRSVSFRIPLQNPHPVKNRIDNTNYHLAGRGRTVIVSKRCKELRKDWETCAWKKGTPDLDKSNAERTHAGDAADYAHWMLARAVGVGRVQLPTQAHSIRDDHQSAMLRGDL